MIYMDNGATTRIDGDALREMERCYTQCYANPSAAYRFASQARTELAGARRRIAALLSAQEAEIVFTSGGSEGNTLAIHGCVQAVLDGRQPGVERGLTASDGRQPGAERGLAASGGRQPGAERGLTASDGRQPGVERGLTVSGGIRAARGQVIVGAAEHSSVYEAARALERFGVQVVTVPVNEAGRVTPAALERLMRPETLLVSVQSANQEIGTASDIRELARIAHAGGALFHTDAVAAAGSMRLAPKETGVDYLTVSAHKFGGPRGIGFLYRRRGAPLRAQIFGGSQEYGLRAGTENLPAILGMALALERRQEQIEAYCRDLREKQALFVRLLRRKVPDVVFHGAAMEVERKLSEGKAAPAAAEAERKLLEGKAAPAAMEAEREIMAFPAAPAAVEAEREIMAFPAGEAALAGNVHFHIPGISGERMVMYLDMEGICVATGSACATGAGRRPRTLAAIGLSESEQEASLRVTLCGDNTEEEIRYVTDKIAEKRKSAERKRG